jgi:hypothetical protein
MILKDRKDQRSQYADKVKMILEVIAANTEAVAGLKNTMETSSAQTGGTVGRIHARIDETMKLHSETAATLTKIMGALESPVRRFGR